MEQKFFLKEIEKRLADMEADLAGIREILNQMIQAEETDDKPEIEAAPETAEAPEVPMVEYTPEVVVVPKTEPVSEDVREAVDVVGQGARSAIESSSNRCAHKDWTLCGVGCRIRF